MNKHEVFKRYCMWQTNEYCSHISRTAVEIKCLQKNCPFWRELNKVIWKRYKKERNEIWEEQDNESYLTLR